VSFTLSLLFALAPRAAPPHPRHHATTTIAPLLSAESSAASGQRPSDAQQRTVFRSAHATCTTHNLGRRCAALLTLDRGKGRLPGTFNFKCTLWVGPASWSGLRSSSSRRRAGAGPGARFTVPASGRSVGVGGVGRAARPRGARRGPGRPGRCTRHPAAAAAAPLRPGPDPRA
jgi:hypothetical protein